MSATNILINVGAQTSKAVSNLQDVRKELGKVDTDAKKWSPSLKKSLNVAAVAFTAVGAAAVGIGAAMVDFGKAAYDDALAAEGLADVLDKIPGVTQAMIDKNAAWIDSMELATAIADDDLRESIGKLAVATGDLGEAQELTALAADVAIARNISLDEATKNLEKAVGGNTNALKRQMPWLDKNRDGTVSVDEAVQGLTKAYGGAAKAASDRDPWEKLKTIWGQLREQLGQWLLPLIDRFADWFKNEQNQKKVKEFLDKMGDLSYELGEKLVPYLEDAYGKFKEFVRWLGDEKNQDKINDWIDAFKTTARRLSDIASAAGAVASAFGRLFAPLERAWNALPEWLRNWIKNGMPIVPGYGKVNSPRSMNLAPAAYSGLSQYGRTGNVTNVVNLHGSATAADARLVKRVLEGYDIAQGRYAGEPLRVAW